MLKSMMTKERDAQQIIGFLFVVNLWKKRRSRAKKVDCPNHTHPFDNVLYSCQ
jgi:hypothetical protein